jgi:hypothetical protein
LNDERDFCCHALNDKCSKGNQATEAAAEAHIDHLMSSLVGWASAF